MCDHRWRLESSDTPNRQGRRTVIFICQFCGEQMAKVTTRPDREIQAELDAQ